MALKLDERADREEFSRWLSPSIWLLLVGAYLACVKFAPPMTMMWEAIILPLILAGTILHAGSLVGRVLEHAVLRWFGRISYSLYLWQQLFLIPHDFERRLGPLQVFPLNLVALLACAVVSYYALEKPMIAYGRRLQERLNRSSFPLAARRAET
jgi:peptidoglycan/LPS O-acetylase OafA/YrhL